MYDVVVDVVRYREFVPWCIRSDIVQPRYPNMFKAHMEIGFQVVKEQYMALVTHQKPTLVKV
jgi:coenzyme Q-binding protein COQ10